MYNISTQFPVISILPKNIDNLSRRCHVDYAKDKVQNVLFIYQYIGNRNKCVTSTMFHITKSVYIICISL